MDILEFWFGKPPASPEDLAQLMRRWFRSDEEIDAEVSRRYSILMTTATAGELDDWGGSARGRLALILLLDQCPRNIFRGQPAAFARDELALGWVLDGLSRRLDHELEPLERMFFYMPMQHSESLEIQDRSVEKFAKLAAVDAPEYLRQCLLNSSEFAHTHQEIIARFDRFPHRNSVLNRKSTAAERDYLKKGAPTFGQ